MSAGGTSEPMYTFDCLSRAKAVLFAGRCTVLLLWRRDIRWVADYRDVLLQPVHEDSWQRTTGTGIIYFSSVYNLFFKGKMELAIRQLADDSL
jgi:hypothetical protein